jgi:hypothetical protein
MSAKAINVEMIAHEQSVKTFGLYRSKCMRSFGRTNREIPFFNFCKPLKSRHVPPESRVKKGDGGGAFIKLIIQTETLTEAVVSCLHFVGSRTTAPKVPKQR